MPVSEQDQARLYMISAGTLGSMVRLSIEKKLTWKQAVATVIAGGATAVFFAPHVNNYLPNHTPETGAGVAFVFGLVGMELCRSVIRVVAKRIDGALEGAADKIPGIGQGGEKGDTTGTTESGDTTNGPDSEGEK